MPIIFEIDENALLWLLYIGMYHMTVTLLQFQSTLLYFCK